MIHPGNKPEDIALELDEVPWVEQADICRVLWFHLQAFIGEQGEMDDLISYNDAMALRGSVTRLLASYSDSTVLLFLRGLIEVLSCDCVLETGRQNLQTGRKFVTSEYRFDGLRVVDASIMPTLIGGKYQRPDDYDSGESGRLNPE